MGTSFINGVYLGYQKVSDNNFITSFITDNGMFKLRAFGLENLTSKNRNNLIPGAVVKLEYFASRFPEGIGRLKKATKIDRFEVIDLDIVAFYQKCYKFFQQIQEPNYLVKLYQHLIEKSIKENLNAILIIIYMHGLVHFGARLSYWHCAKCNKTTKLTTFNFEEGGFLCTLHHRGKYMSRYALEHCYYIYTKPLVFLKKYDPSIISEIWFYGHSYNLSKKLFKI
ncbi:hypothetical protein [Mycoplasmopsis sturni]|uniref:hypothetical protein n=1 Tax=Mycoplasmopsis sturni TaxID=39047 RepID=UPI0012EC39E0|nr:hypothetical protein [Mycoplasmopsis sturni]